MSDLSAVHREQLTQSRTDRDAWKARAEAAEAEAEMLQGNWDDEIRACAAAEARISELEAALAQADQMCTRPPGVCFARDLLASNTKRGDR